MSTTRFS